MSDPVRQLVEQHNQLRRLFKQVPGLGPQQSAQQRAYAICDLLTIHGRLEEEIIYPVVRDLDPALAEKASAEHHHVDALIERICEQAYRANHEVKRDVNVLERAVTSHARWEEDNLLPRVNRLPGEEFDRIGRALYLRHQELLREYPDAMGASAGTEGYSAGPLI